MEAENRGWTAPEKFVCAECVGDEFLANVIESNLSAYFCSYCHNHKEKLIATEVKNIMPYVADTFFHYFEEPGSAGLPRDLRDLRECGGEQLIINTVDAFILLGWKSHDDLFNDICKAFIHDTWVPHSDGWW
ncbi:MAG: HEPN-associated N-terminal domain-containing protein [Candidatus Electrothrix sp. YB6]